MSVQPTTEPSYTGSALAVNGAFATGRGLAVPPHPREIVHRDSLGPFQPIRPGDICWMTAGRGIVHSERTAAERRKQALRLHGLQLDQVEFVQLLDS